MLGTEPRQLSLDKQRNLDERLINAAWEVDTQAVQAALAAGANVHAQDDLALCRAASYGDTEMVRVFANYIFGPDAWRGKSRAEIEAHANALYDRIRTIQPLAPIKPDRLRETGAILADCAIDCWHQVRPPPPPQFKISPFPAQPRTL